MSARPNVTVPLSGEESQLVHEAAEALAVPPEKLLAAAAVAFARLCGFRNTATASARRAPNWGPQPVPEIPEAILEVPLNPESADQVEAAAGYVRWEGPDGPLPITLSEYVVGATTRLIRETRSEGPPPSYRGLAEQLFNLAPRPRGESAFRASLGGPTTSAAEIPLPFEAPAAPIPVPIEATAQTVVSAPRPSPPVAPPVTNRPAYTLPRPERTERPERPERPSYTLPRRAPAEREAGDVGTRRERARGGAASAEKASPRGSALRGKPTEARTPAPVAKGAAEPMVWLRQHPLVVGATAAGALLLVLLALAYSWATAPPTAHRSAPNSAGTPTSRAMAPPARAVDPLRLDPPPKDGETAELALKRWEDVAPAGPEVPATPFRRSKNHGKNIDELLNERYGRPKVLADASLKPEAYDADIAEAVADVVHIYPVPPALVKAVIRRESNFNPNAVSQVGAIGMMQLMPYTAKKVGLQVSDLWVPKKNILGGTRLLSALLQYYEGDVISVLTAYNARPREPLAPLPKNGETPEYVAAVLRFYEEYTGSPLQEPSQRNPTDAPLRPGP